MITEYGKQLRKIRVDNEEVLKDMAERMGVTSAYVSAIEIGKRPIPENFTNLIIQKYGLNEVQSEALRVAEERSLTVLKLEMKDSSSVKRQTAAVFAREFENLNEDTANKILKILSKGKG